MSHSGAYLTWKYFFPNHKVPLMISYIEDRDIWKNALPHYKEFGAWFYTLPLEFKTYDLYFDDNKLLEMIHNRGPAFQELNQYYMEQAGSKVNIKFTKIKNRDNIENYYFIAYKNSLILKSDIGNYIIQQFPFIDFSVVYSIDDINNSTAFSLRSSPKHTDVSQIATIFGGGGHRNASGLYLNCITNTLPGIVYDNNGELYERIKNIYYEERLTSELMNNGNDEKYNIVYLHSNTCKHKLGHYLLQTRYVENDIKYLVPSSGGWKNCNVILMEKYGYHYYSLAVVWSYDPFKDITEFVITFDKSLSDDIISNISNYLGLDQRNKLSYSGCKKFLPSTSDLTSSVPLIHV